MKKMVALVVLHIGTVELKLKFQSLSWVLRSCELLTQVKGLSMLVILTVCVGNFILFTFHVTQIELPQM